jgi:class 3 adenylate cyclase
VSTSDVAQSIDGLLDRAIQALNDGDRTTAARIAEQVLAVDGSNSDAEDLLAAPTSDGEIRRLTIFFADLVDSTVLSTRIDPETYRTVVGTYRDRVLDIVNRYEGHVGNTKGDGLLGVFGHPRAHENDVRRAVQAGLEITREIAKLSDRVRRRFGFEINVRVGVHRGVVYLDTAQDDVYGLAANLTARVSGLAPPGTVVVSGAIEPLLRRDFELEELPARTVKGIEGPVEHYVVLAEKPDRPRIALGPLVGRRHELSELQRLWSDAESGTLTTPGVALLGESGIGKSRLATEVAKLAERSGATVLTLFGSPFHGDAGLHPIRSLLERRCGIGRATAQDERLELLNRGIASCALDPTAMLPLLAPVLGITADAGYQPASSDGRKLHRRIVDAVRDYLLAALGDGPGLVLFEDLQWFDPSTIEVVNGLLCAGNPRVLVVCTARGGGPLPDEVVTLPLAPFTDAETNELVAATNPELSQADRAEVRRRCDGVPLYIEEVVAKLTALQANALPEVLQRDSSEWQRVPDALYEPLFARLRASENALPVVVAAATIGRDVDRATLLPVLDLTAEEVATATTALENARVLEPVSPHAWRFRHELLREVAAELPPPSQRRALHGRIADAIRATSGDQPDWRELALHYSHAERFDEAAMACQKASSDARRRGALNEARGYLSRAIDHIGRLPAGPRRDQREVTARLQRGFLISAAEGTSSADAAADFERCLELETETSPLRETLLTMTALYSYYLTRCDLARAEQLLNTVRSKMGDGRNWFLPANESGVGQLAWFHGDFDAARRIHESCAAANSQLGDLELERTWFMPHEPIASIHTNLALARFIHGDVAGTDAALLDTERRCQDVPFPHGSFSLCYSLSMEGWIRTEAGEFDRASTVVDELTARSEQHGFDGWLLIATAQRAAITAMAAVTADPVDVAAVKEAGVAVARCLKILRAVHLVTFLTVYESMAAQCWLAVGEPERARARIEVGLIQADETGLDFYRAELLRHRAATWNDTDRRDADLGAALDLGRRQSATIFFLRSAVDLVTYTGASGHGVLIEAIARFPADSTWPELIRARELLG